MNDCYYKLYEESVRTNFIELHGDILLFRNGVGQFDDTDTLVSEFSCKYDCLRQLRISDKTLAKSLENGMAISGLVYKMIGSRMMIE